MGRFMFSFVALLVGASQASAGSSSSIKASAALQQGRLSGSGTVESALGDDMAMGATFKNDKISNIYCKVTESFGDIMLKMNVNDNSFTGALDMSHSEVRTVASFDTSEPTLITKVALTSDKMSIGSVPIVATPTYNAVSKLLDLKLVAELAAKTKLSLSVSQGSSPTSLEINHVLASGPSIKAVGSTGGTKLELATRGMVRDHKLSGKIGFKKLGVPKWQTAWARKFGSSGSASVTIDADEVELETTAKLGKLGDWTATTITPYRAARATKVSLTTKFAL